MRCLCPDHLREATIGHRTTTSPYPGHRPHFFRLFAFTLAISCEIALPARADDAHRTSIYDSSGFEPWPFSGGSQLLGTDGWSLAIPPFLNPEAARITNVASNSGRQSVEVWGGDLASSGGITAPYDAVGSYRLPLARNVSSRKPIVMIEGDLLLETNQPVTNADFFSMTLAARSGDGETLGEIGLSSSGFAEAYGFNAAPGATPLFIEPIELNQWHQVNIVMDYSSGSPEVSYFLDGDCIGVMQTSSASRVLLRGAMVVYARPDGDGSTRDDYTARFDNFRVTQHGTDRNTD